VHCAEESTDARATGTIVPIVIEFLVLLGLSMRAIAASRMYLRDAR
jgi:hypothetical protein